MTVTERTQPTGWTCTCSAAARLGGVAGYLEPGDQQCSLDDGRRMAPGGTGQGVCGATARVNAAPGGTVSFDLTALAQEWVSSPAGTGAHCCGRPGPSTTCTHHLPFRQPAPWASGLRPNRQRPTPAGGQAHGSWRGVCLRPRQPGAAAVPEPRRLPTTPGVATIMQPACVSPCVCRMERPARTRSHYPFADHLGARTSRTTQRTHTATVQRYYPWGAVRPGPGNTLPTGYTYTGQLDSGLGLMYYGARFTTVT